MPAADEVLICRAVCRAIRNCVHNGTQIACMHCTWHNT